MMKVPALVSVCLGANPPYSIAVDAQFHTTNEWGEILKPPSIARFALSEMADYTLMLVLDGKPNKVRGDVIAEAFLELVGKFADRAPEQDNATRSTRTR